MTDEARGALDESQMENVIAIDLAPIARDLNLSLNKVQQTLELLDEGNTVPFITRYRKDQTGAMEDEQIRELQTQVAKLRALAERKQTILKSIEAQGKLTDSLTHDITHATTTKRLEDLYLPYKPKKQTLATQARQRGLEPLALALIGGEIPADQWEARVETSVREEGDPHSAADVIQGVRHLLAEHFSEQVELRDRLRKLIRQTGKLVVTKLPPPPAPSEVESASRMTEPPPSEMPSGEAAPGEAQPESAAQEKTPSEVPSVASETEEKSDGESTVAEGQRSEKTGEETTDAVVATSSLPPTDSDTGAVSDGSDLGSQKKLEDGTGTSGSEPNEKTSMVESSPSEPASDAVPPPTSARDAKRQTGNEKRNSGKSGKNAKKQKKRQKLEAAFKDYFQFSESLNHLPPHRVLAINRGERARILRVKLELNFDAVFEAASVVVPPEHPQRDFMLGCLRDALQRLILPSLEREARRELTEVAEAHAVEVFIRNLRKLLLQPPVRSRRVLAIDPGFRSGCKLIAIDQFGNVLGQELIHVIGREDRRKEGRGKLVQFVRQHQLSLIAIGNGTGCRETEQLVAEVLGKELADSDLAYVMVNEAGASVYSTSPLGREELPDFDPVLRSAISIGRRLLDPLSELVKINPANIGVGLYQHDVKAKHLRDSLDAVVESCVNFVGVDVNTASPALLRYVSGLNQLTARRMYEYRLQHGPFRSREEFLKVPGFGEQTFIQAAGFLKIVGGDNPLDATWIHPESYSIAQHVLQDLEEDVDVLRPPAPPPAPLESNPSPEAPDVAPDAAQAPSSASPPDPVESADSSTTAGPPSESLPTESLPTESLPTESLPTESLPTESLPTESLPTESLPTESLPTESPPTESLPTESLPTESPPSEGDSGLTESRRQEWLSRRAELANRIARVAVNDLAERLGVGRLLLQDILATLTRPERDPRDDLPPPVFRRGIMKLEDLQPGMELSGTVLNVVDFGAFVDIGLTESGLVHISRLADRFIRDPHEVVGVGDHLKVWVLEVDKQRRRVSLTAVEPGAERRRPEPRERAASPAADPASRPRPDRSPRSATHPPASASRRDKGKRPSGGKGRTWTSKPSKAAPPLTKAMEDGKEPLRSFSDLLQFYEKKTQEPDSTEGSAD